MQELCRSCAGGVQGRSLATCWKVLRSLLLAPWEPSAGGEVWDGDRGKEAGMYGLRARKGRYKEHRLRLWRTVMADSEGWVWTVKPGGSGDE